MEDIWPRLLVSIDFGTYGFYVVCSSPTDAAGAFEVGNWPGHIDKLHYKKVLSTLLVHKKTDETLGFGFQAYDLFMGKEADSMPCSPEDVMYFTNFKLELLQENNFNKNKKICAQDGVSEYPLCKLISKLLKEIVSHTLSQDEVMRCARDPNEILWILSVPAIWSEESKQTMRECCYSIGIKDRSVKIVSEPEAAASFLLWNTDAGKKLQEGDTYMCLDVGGGTYDAVFHQIVENRQVIEVESRGGGLSGGVHVDDEFFILLDTIIGHPVSSEFQSKYPVDYATQRRKFQMARESQKNSSINVDIVYKLAQFVLEKHHINFKDACKEKKFKFRRSTNQLVLSEENLEQLHSCVVDKITKFAQTKLELEELSEIKSLFLVGGFAKSRYLREALNRMLGSEQFEHRQIQLIEVNEPELCVPKGSIWYATKQFVKTRQFQFTYGISVDEMWRPGLPVGRDEINPHTGEKVGQLDTDPYTGEKIVRGVFKPLLWKGDEWEVGYRKKFDFIIGHQQSSVSIVLYKCDVAPIFVDSTCDVAHKYKYDLENPLMSISAEKLQCWLECTDDRMRLSFSHTSGVGKKEFYLNLGYDQVDAEDTKEVDEVDWMCDDYDPFPTDVDFGECTAKIRSLDDRVKSEEDLVLVDGIAVD